MKLISYIIMLFMFISCSTFQPQVANQKLEVDKFYKRDMIINGYEGVLVLPKQPLYDLMNG